MRRYESGASQPTLDVIPRLAVALQVSADVLVFAAMNAALTGFQLQFEAISKFAPEEKQIIKALLEGNDPQARSQTLVLPREPHQLAHCLRLCILARARRLWLLRFSVNSHLEVTPFSH